MPLVKLVLPYPDFVLNTTIDPQQFDDNNAAIKSCTDALVDWANAWDTFWSTYIVPGSAIQDDAISTIKIQDGAVTSQKIGSGEVKATNIDPTILGAVADATHKTNPVIDHPDQSVTTIKIADNAVTTNKVADKAITEAKFAAPIRTTATITYYVNTTTGNDANDGLTNGTAFKTIQYAIDKLPKILLHNATINVAAGTYAEDILISGFSGSGSIFLYGDTVLSDNYVVNSITVRQNVSYVVVRGFKPIRTDANAIMADRTIRLNCSYCRINTNSANIGIQINSSIGIISSCEISNRSHGIWASNGSTVYSATNIGTGNTYGLYADSAGSISKSSTQPAASLSANNEYIINGGQIRDDATSQLMFRINSGALEYSNDRGTTWNAISSASPVGSFEFGFPMI